jgi:succinyl-CoA synthetase beta subunit
VFLDSGVVGLVHKASTVDEVADLAEKMCGRRFHSLANQGDISAETDNHGFICKCVFIMEELAIDKEFYVSIHNSRKTQSPVITYAKHGELPFDKIMKDHPQDIFRHVIDYQKGLNLQDLRSFADNLGVRN